MSEEAQPRPSDRFIPWYFVLFFAVQAVIFTGFAHIAFSTFTGLVTEDAYDKGITYNKTIEKAKEQAALGFTSTIAYKDGRFVFTLTDGHGKPVTGESEITLMLFRPVHAGDDVTMALKPENGAWVAKMTPPEPGLWDVRIHAVAPKWHYQTSKRMVLE